jgi:hypothetical protein
MSTQGQGSHGEPTVRTEVLPVQVHSCTRLGRAANPPRTRLGGWLRRR